MFGIRRREFITLVGSVAAWPFYAQAQQAAVPVIGFLHAASPKDWAPSVAAFRQHVCRPNSQGHQALRSTNPAVRESSVGHQPQGCKGARPHRSLAAAWPRRRGDRVKRREFISLLSGAAAAWPLAARAQQPAMPVIGFLNGGSAAPLRRQVSAFHQGLQEAGYVEGQNVAVDYRFAEGQFDRLKGMAEDLVRRQVSVITASSVPAALAAKRATTTIPTVFSIGDDPVKLGLVASLNRPSGNATGMYELQSGLEAKRLGLLHDLVPSATTVAVLVNPNTPTAEMSRLDAEEAAAKLGVKPIILTADLDSEFDGAFGKLARERAAALLVTASAFFTSRRQYLILLAMRHGVPAIYHWRDFAEAGGLMSYGTNLIDAYRQLGIYAGRILKGVKIIDLPVVQSTKFELVINLNAAKALGLTVPNPLLVAADEVIE
jgi:putative tryptophan/tyrosine transport system substrate-binding protein